MPKKIKPVEVVGPIVGEVKFHLVHARSLQACRDAIDKAQSLIQEAKAQLICIELEAFFKKHPYVSNIELDGSWESNDEGGSNFWLNAEFGYNDSPSKKVRSKRDDDSLSEELVSIFEGWEEEVADLGEIDGDSGVDQVGQLLMQGGYRKWRSEVERFALEQVAGKPASSLEGELRL